MSKLNLKVQQGSTLRQVLRWESSTVGYATVAGVTLTAPLSISAPGNSVPVGWRVKPTNVGGTKQLNTDQYLTVTDKIGDTLVFNAVNATAFTAYTSGGVLEYNTPVSITGYSAKMQLREKVSSVDILDELTTENSRILLDTALSTITVVFPASVTSAYAFKQAVYSLELTSPAGDITTLISGNITVEPEVTRA